MPDLDASFEKVRNERLDVSFPILRADAGLRTFAIRDPERNVIQFVGR